MVTLRNSRGGGYIKIIDPTGEQQYRSEELGGEYFLHVANTDFEHRVAITDSNIYASGWDQSDTARLAAFDADSGQRQWTHDIDSASPQNVIPFVAADTDRVYFAAKDSEVLSDDQSTATVLRAVSASDGTELWEQEWDGFPIRGLGVFDSQVIFGLDETLYWFNPAAGTVASQIDLHSWKGFIRDGRILYTADSTLRSFDLTTGEQLGSTERDREPDEQCLVSNGMIFCATNPGYLTAHDLTSLSKSWEVQVNHSITTQPGATDSVVFVADSNGNYSGVNIETGEIVYTDTQSARDIRLAGLSDFICIAVRTGEDSFAQGFAISGT
ncbi:hypothetical protein DM826_00885 [Halonotius aquaticus]|uniref:Pyrrolo-quinoline quinone repeat domain-containing protein n=1 Tax=Halonotius aquaticus TaxID=2216978 RepID=A0A3A6PTU1_9EURY|nr:PQQ-binding-like beta-propeller repeat protein [Halonotius aquaticus]RJX45017.1 hypothetical protein DM826_00885 [Halonotius aquaticus]